MSFTHTVIEQIQTSGRKVASSNDYTGDAQDGRAIAVPDATTDQLVNFTMDVSQLKSIFMLSDQNITVETNSPSAPTDTINLTAGVPYIWFVGSYFANLFTADVTALYVSNASGAAATLDIEIVHDATP